MIAGQDMVLGRLAAEVWLQPGLPEGLLQDPGFEQGLGIRVLGLVKAAETSKVFAGPSRVDVGAFRDVFDAGDLVSVVIVV